MGAKKHVFGSNSERDNFYKLSRSWSEKYRIYHNLPFLSVFDIQNLADYSKTPPVPFTVVPADLARLKKTSIDFTLCDVNDRPQLCIEFDGLQEGFNLGLKYHAETPPDLSDPWRQQIMELKLKVALGSKFPFLVVGTDYFKDLTSTIQLTIVDGIIGEIFAYKTFRNWFQTRDFLGEMRVSEEEFNQLSSTEQQYLVDRWGTSLEVEASLATNPISRMGSKLKTKLIQSGLLESMLYQHSKSETSFQVQCTVKLKNLGHVTKAVRLPNFEIPGFYTGYCCEEIAEVLALESAVKLLERFDQIPLE